MAGGAVAERFSVMISAALRSLCLSCLTTLAMLVVPISFSDEFSFSSAYGLANEDQFENEL